LRRAKLQWQKLEDTNQNLNYPSPLGLGCQIQDFWPEIRRIWQSDKNNVDQAAEIISRSRISTASFGALFLDVPGVLCGWRVRGEFFSTLFGYDTIHTGHLNSYTEIHGEGTEIHGGISTFVFAASGPLVARTVTEFSCSGDKFVARIRKLGESRCKKPSVR